MTLKEKLTAEINEKLTIMSQFKVDSKEYRAAAGSLKILVDSLKEIETTELESKKFSNSVYDAEKKAELEQKKFEESVKDQTRKAELEEARLAFQRSLEESRELRERKNSHWDRGIKITGILAPLAVGIWANKYNWYKEVNGIMTSTGGKNVMRALTDFVKIMKF